MSERLNIAMVWGNVRRNRGLDGKSAYEIAVLNGFVGTESEWLESLKGEDGAPGANGTDGITPHIGMNGNWWIDTTDTGIPATGADGEDGREVEFRENAGYVEWRYVGDASWTQLYLIPTGGGGGSDAPELHLDFEEAGDEFVYNVPYAMKFTSMVCEGTDATLDIALNTTMARYDRLTITATDSGLVSLYGEYV